MRQITLMFGLLTLINNIALYITGNLYISTKLVTIEELSVLRFGKYVDMKLYKYNYVRSHM